MNCYDINGPIHRYGFHFKAHPKEKAERLICACSGFKITYSKQVYVGKKRIVNVLNEMVREKEKDIPKKFTTSLELQLDEQIPIVLFSDSRLSEWDLCHISAESEGFRENIVVCMRPLKKRVEIAVMDVSEELLEKASGFANIHYNRFGYQPGFRKGLLFNKVFPPINELMLPRVYKQNVMDYLNESWMRKRSRRDSVPIHPECQKNLMRLIDKAFEAYQLERTVIDLLGIKKEERSEYIRRLNW